MSYRSKLLAGALGLCVLHALAPSARAQSNTSGSITGIVYDDATGAPLGGVTVVAASPVLQGTQAELTDDTGLYTINNLPPGTYAVTFFYSDVTVTDTPAEGSGVDLLVTVAERPHVQEVVLRGLKKLEE